MTSLTVFAFESQEIRFVDGKPVANDVAKVLGYKNPANAVNRMVKASNKGLCDLQTPSGIQSTTVLEESGIYQLIFGSKLPAAETFQQWVFSEVLPSIRKTGKYEIAPSQPALPQTFSEALRLAADLEDQKQKLMAENQALQIEVQTLEPKADRYDLILATDGWMTGEEIVKQLAIPKFSVRKLYDILRQEKVLFKRPSDGLNMPYAEYVNEGLAKLRDGQCFDGRMRFSPAFSWKGLDRILDLLRKHQVIPKDKQYRFNFDSDKIVAMKRA
jgi:prophage antirepressor-like protein